MEPAILKGLGLTEVFMTPLVVVAFGANLIKAVIVYYSETGLLHSECSHLNHSSSDTFE